MSDALLTIQELIETHQQALAAEPEVHWEGRAYEPRPGVPWVQVQMIGRVRAPMALGVATPHLWRGQLMIAVKHPADTGDLRAAYARAGVVAAHWKRGTTLGTPPLVVVVQETSLPPAYTSGGFITQPVIAAWFTQEHPP
jgi:hypothetical protein